MSQWAVNRICRIPLLVKLNLKLSHKVGEINVVNLEMNGPLGEVDHNSISNIFNFIHLIDVRYTRP